MTEKQWLEYDDPQLLLQLLRGRADARRLWLAAHACCRLVSELTASTSVMQALCDAESWADGGTDWRALQGGAEAGAAQAVAGSRPVAGAGTDSAGGRSGGLASRLPGGGAGVQAGSDGAHAAEPGGGTPGSEGRAPGRGQGGPGRPAARAGVR
jgi:hypothetical protein